MIHIFEGLPFYYQCITIYLSSLKNATNVRGTNWMLLSKRRYKCFSQCTLLCEIQNKREHLNQREKNCCDCYRAEMREDFGLLCLELT